MMQQPTAEDFVIATGETHSVREFVEETFGLLGMDWQKYVELDQRYLRPSEVDLLLGDPSKAQRAFGWRPKVTFKELVKMMVEADMDLAKQEQMIAAHDKGRSGPESHAHIRLKAAQ